MVSNLSSMDFVVDRDHSLELSKYQSLPINDDSNNVNNTYNEVGLPEVESYHDSFVAMTTPTQEKKGNVRHFLIYFLVLTAIFAVSLYNYLLPKHIPLMGSISKTIPYKFIMHPEPPTGLWGVVTKPFPTGSFWTNLVVRGGDGAIGLYPYGIKTLDIGIQVSYGASRRVVSKLAITDPFLCDLQISSTQQYLSRSVEGYDNMSVTMGYRTALNGRYRAHLVKGSLFVTTVFDNATPVISSPYSKIVSVDAKVVKDSVGTQYIVSLGNFQKWLVYCSEPVAFIWKENTLTSPVPIRGVVRVAILPPVNSEQAFNLLLGYVQRYPTSVAVSFSYSGTTATVLYQYATVGLGSLLMLSLPHHSSILQSPVVDNDENRRIQVALGSIWSIKGKLKAVVGDIWRLQYSLLQVGWHYTLNEKLTTQQLDEIAKHLIQDVKTIIPTAPDPYSFGKQLGRMSRLALIADNLGIADARQQAIVNLETSLIPWLQGVNSNPFLYDRLYGGLVTANGISDPNSEFGSGWYSDHHFHYGYFLLAAATLARFDSPFYEANKAAFDTIARDICNPDSGDADFPFARHKDLFDGHSWASGLFQQANGKGQESSSEAANAYYGAYLYGLATGNPELYRFAHLLLTMEVQSAQVYWHMIGDNIYDNVFSGSRMVGNIGALDVTASTWFGSELEFVHGINMMPLSPVTSCLFDQSYVQLQYPVLATRLPAQQSVGQQQCSLNAGCRNLGMIGQCCPTVDGVFMACCDDTGQMQDEWRSFISIDLAVVDRDTAWGQVLSLNGFGIGNSKANSLFWVASRAAPVVGFNSAPKAADVTVKSACAANSACDAVGMQGECCPSATGVTLGCCPKV